ncbi:carbohydrate kinase family protein [Haloparvum sp. PAK95]|uniref:carbohydrate kinase family protein n=1 Tax=Haloparvum sp. PAK95 TaxID=3418962 RepID=UPI003D2EC521
MHPSVLVAGETLVDFLPGSRGPLSSVETFTRRPGGAPANVAVALSRLGEVPWFWTRVGADPFGEDLLETLVDEGLPERFLVSDPDAKTSLAFVAHDEDADREFSFYRNGTADTRLEPGAVPDAVLADLDWVSVGGVALASGSSREATLDLAERAREQGAKVWFDPNARPELWEDDFPALFAEMLGHADVVKASEEDLAAAGIEGDSPAELAEALHELGPDTVFLTMGASGAFASATADAPWGPATVTYDGFDVEPVDTTGAGDAFTAGALLALYEGEPLGEVLAFASAVAAVTTTGEGAMTALPDRETVAEFRSEGVAGDDR